MIRDWRQPKVLIGLDGGKLCSDGSYQAIIHPALIQLVNTLMCKYERFESQYKVSFPMETRSLAYEESFAMAKLLGGN